MNIDPESHQNVRQSPVSSSVEDYLTPEQRWAAVVSRDRSANTAFYYGAITTHIFCRPTCTGRVARKANVVFFDDLSAARALGYRACKRCKPEQRVWDRDGAALRILAQSQILIDQAVSTSTPWTVEQISNQLGITAAHLHRLFRKHLSTTPKEFATGGKQSDHVLTKLESNFNFLDEEWHQSDWSEHEFGRIPEPISGNIDFHVYDETLQDYQDVFWDYWLASETSGLNEF